MNDETGAQGPGSAPEHSGADPERLRFGVAPTNPDAESTIAPSPLDRPIGAAAARQAATDNPERPNPDVLRNVEASADGDVLPLVVPSVEPLYVPPAPPERDAGPAREATVESDVLPASDLMGLPVVDLAQGKGVGHVKDVIFDPKGERLSGFSVALPGLFGGMRILAWESVHAVGKDAVTIENASALRKERDENPLEDAVEHGHTVIGKRMLADNGNVVGTVEDLVVSRRTGEALGFHMRGEGKDNRFYLPAVNTIAVGEDVVTVPAYLTDYRQDALDGLEDARRAIHDRPTG